MTGRPEHSSGNARTADLDGAAATPPPPNVAASTPAEFAARWNERSDEERQQWLDRFRSLQEADILRFQQLTFTLPAADAIWLSAVLRSMIPPFPAFEIPDLAAKVTDLVARLEAS